MTAGSTADWLRRVPKVELHLHLEGAIPHAALWELVQKYGGDPALPDRQALARRFAYRDFPHFIETWIWKNRFLREYEDFTLIAEAVARELARQNVRYVEAHYSPSDFRHRGLEPQPLTAAIRRGLDRVPEVEMALVADLVRDSVLPAAACTLAQVREVRDLGVIGIGLGGSEQTFPPEPFADLFAKARRHGFHTCTHAGEAAGAESVWGAIRSLRAERLGHATRAEEDPALVDYLAEHRIPLELCPISNLRTKVVPSIDAHPVRRYFERGLLVTINTDDPEMFGNSLAQEFQALVEVHGFSRDEIRTLILNAVRASWLPADRRRHLAADLQDDPDWR